MLSTIREILKNNPQMFILNYFHQGNLHPDWALARREEPYLTGEIRMLHTLWRNQSDSSQILSVKMIENTSAVESIANLKEVAGHSARRQVSEEEVANQNDRELLGAFAPRFFVPEAQLLESPEQLTAIKYALGNMTVEINNAGATTCYLTQIRDLAKNFFLIPDLANGKIKVKSEHQIKVEPVSNSTDLALLLPNPGDDIWYMVLLSQPEAQIYRSGDQVLVTPGPGGKEGLVAFVLRVHRAEEPVVYGPVPF